MSDTKPTNPKDAIGADKIPFHLWPETATILGVLALLEGALKYGRGNWRAIGVKSSIYYDAAMRHMKAWFEGEDVAPDSEIDHLGHALACLAILIDARAAGKLNDDRALPGGYHALLEAATPHVKRLKAAHADKSPHHYTRADAAPTTLGPGQAIVALTDDEFRRMTGTVYRRSPDRARCVHCSQTRSDHGAGGVCLKAVL